MRTRMGIIIMILGGTFAEWSALWTRNPVVSGSSPPLATCWISARSSRVLNLDHFCKLKANWLNLLPVGVFNTVLLYLNYLFLNI